MSQRPKTLTREQSAEFYDALGAKQDWQAFFEVPAMRDLIAHADLQNARAVVEFGCGTGAFAEETLAQHLPPVARYLALDSSATMVGLAQERLARFGSRVTVRQTDGSFRVDEPSNSFDRVVSNYLFDLLSPADMTRLLAEADRLLAAEGSLCLVSITHGETPLPRLVTGAWAQLHALEPRLLGGCRPLNLHTCLPSARWRVAYSQVITRFGIPSAVLVATKQWERDTEA
jgi:cyclopropane fatty-acyl-phospholipid synthase-like methyltransferase